METYLKYQSPARQFLAFLGLASAFFLLSILASILFFSDLSGVLTAPAGAITPAMLDRFKLAQGVSTIIIFVLPAAFFAYFSSPRPFAYAGLHNSFSATIFILSVVLVFAIQPDRKSVV